MYQLAIFDMAGTTIDDRDEVYRVLREATEREGADYTDNEFQNYMGTEKKWAIRHLLEIGGVDYSAASVDKAWQWFREELARTYTEQPPVPLDGIEDMVVSLRDGGVKVALTTGFSREITDLILKNMGWSVGETIDASIAGDEVETGRPEPYMIQKAMADLGVTDADEVISVGDTSADIISAQRAGVTSVGVLTGHLDEEQFAELGADHILRSAADISSFLK